MNNEKRITIATVLTGFSLVSEVFSDTEGVKIGLLLGGIYDHEIQVALFYRHYSRLPGTLEELSSDEISKLGLERLKNSYRHILNKALLEEEKRLFKEAAEKARNAFKAMHSQAPEGSVKELAAKYNKSISEIRRMKAEGRLHELSKESENEV